MPYSYPTTPGVTYAVECAGDVTVTNEQTGAVAVTGDGSASVYFTAADNLYVISNDSAKVQPLFKPAPRLRLTLLQGGAGGWLPKGFTTLEYLKSSGTQYIETQLEVDSTWGAKVEWEMTYVTNYASVMNAGNTDSEGKPINAGSFFVPYWNGVISPFYASFMNNGEHLYSLNAQAEIGVRYVSLLNFRNSREVKLNEESLGVIPEDVQSFTCKNPVLFGTSRNGTPFNGARLIGKIFCVQISKGAALKMYLVPVLNAEGVPGMFDKVSKRFFANHGTGTFGYAFKGQGSSRTYLLRNRSAVPPSGVYARKADANNMEILADTEELSGDGWMWFANTAEAYAHFGIMPEEKKNF